MDEMQQQQLLLSQGQRAKGSRTTTSGPTHSIIHFNVLQVQLCTVGEWQCTVCTCACCGDVHVFECCASNEKFLRHLSFKSYLLKYLKTAQDNDILRQSVNILLTNGVHHRPLPLLLSRLQRASVSISVFSGIHVSRLYFFIPVIGQECCSQAP